MDRSASLDRNTDDVVVTTMSQEVLEAIGTLLAAVARILEGEELRRRGGPGILRRLVSILATLFAFAVVLLIRLRAAAERHAVVPAFSKTQLHLSHPPAGWAAP